MNKLCSGVLIAVLASGLAARADEPWEGRPLSPAQRAACRALPRALVRAVTPAYREQAARLLASAPAVPLDDARAAAWIDVDAPRHGALSERLLTDAVEAIEYRRVISYGEHAPHWSLTEQWVYDTLMGVADAPHGVFTPVLVRAVAGAERDGVFDAADCGGALAVRHGSFGAQPPQAVHVPVIVFLARPPAGVQAWRETLRP